MIAIFRIFCLTEEKWRNSPLPFAPSRLKRKHRWIRSNRRLEWREKKNKKLPLDCMKNRKKQTNETRSGKMTERQLRETKSSNSHSSISIKTTKSVKTQIMWTRDAEAVATHTHTFNADIVSQTILYITLMLTVRLCLSWHVKIVKWICGAGTRTRQQKREKQRFASFSLLNG